MVYLKRPTGTEFSCLIALNPVRCRKAFLHENFPSPPPPPHILRPQTPVKPNMPRVLQECSRLDTQPQTTYVALLNA